MRRPPSPARPSGSSPIPPPPITPWVLPRFGEGKVDDAIAEYRAALRLDPDSPEAHLNLGIALVVKGKLDEAIAEFREAFRSSPTRPMPTVASAFPGRSTASSTRRSPNTARPPTPARRLLETHNNLGITLTAQGKLEQAIAESCVASGMKPDFSRCPRQPRCPPDWIKGNRGGDRRMPRGAAAQAGPHRDPFQPRLRPWLQGKWDEAIAEYREALRLKPRLPEAHCNTGHVLRQQGRSSRLLPS